jgi:hypothetical protein
MHTDIFYNQFINNNLSVLICIHLWFFYLSACGSFKSSGVLNIGVPVLFSGWTRNG